MDETLLRHKVREAIRTGKLPVREPQRVFGGYGSGVDCSICGNPLIPEQVELELEFSADAFMPASSQHVHPRCHAVWDLERRARQPKNESYAGTDFPGTQ